jgi:leader peptidase (prepilin peptidase)/N-methyltransferase
MHTFLSLYAFVIGTLIGSFLNVVILRLPRGEDLVYRRSHCPACQTQLRWYHNIPLLSFLALRGKCAFCGVRISWRYPLIELATGLIAAVLFPEQLTLPDFSAYLFYFAIACVFLCHFFIDLDHHLLLDSLNLYLLALVLAFAVIHHPWQHWLLGGALGFGAPLLVTWLFYKLRGQIGLGGGDIKLYGVLGVLFGPTGIFLTIFLSCFLGALVGLVLIALKRSSRNEPMAFGPAILLVAAFQLFVPEYAQKIQTWLF